MCGTASWRSCVGRVVVFICPAILFTMANKNEEKVYEVSFHLVPDIDPDKVSAVFDWVKGIVSEKGEVLSEEQPVKRDLAYTVRHTVRQRDGSYNRYDEAYFGSVKFRALRGAVRQIELTLTQDEEVLRFLLLETVEEDTRIGEVLPGDEVEEPAEDAEEAADAQEAGESGIAEQPAEEAEGGEKA